MKNLDKNSFAMKKIIFLLLATIIIENFAIGQQTSDTLILSYAAAISKAKWLDMKATEARIKSEAAIKNWLEQLKAMNILSKEDKKALAAYNSSKGTSSENIAKQTLLNIRAKFKAAVKATTDAKNDTGAAQTAYEQAVSEEEAAVIIVEQLQKKIAVNK
jgi:hypothetical protein